MKLGKRLKHIEQMVTSDYTHIWDCCCDHGFLGATLLSRQAAKNIHFVDIVPELMNELERKLKRFYPHSASNWQTHCLDVAKLPLAQHEGKHLIIIAGVGGDLMQKFIESLHRKHPNLKMDFLLCPVHHQFALRNQLIELNFSLKHETLIEENQRFYEIIFASSTPNSSAPISPVGEQIWQENSVTHSTVIKKYLEKTLNHYQRIQQGNTTDVEHILQAYRAVRL